MSFAPLRLAPVLAGLLVVSTSVHLVSCGAERAGSDTVRGDSAATATGTQDESDARVGDDATTGSESGDVSPEARADDTTTRASVTDSIGFPAGKTLVPGQRYNVKSGIIELKSSFMGDLRQTIYFDDYGRKEAVYANANISGKTTRSVMVMANGSNVVYDPVRKTGTRIDLADALTQLGLGGIPNLSSLDANAKRELKYSPVAGRTVLGRKTEGASIEIMGTPVKVWTWEGIPLRMEASMQGNEMVVEATSLKTDVAIATERFIIPDDVKITEYETGR